MGCDLSFLASLVPNAVSIHAPTWGATLSSISTFTESVVSIHAPTWGATLDRLGYVVNAQFQSTHPHGVRLSAGCPNIATAVVSIHAPTWGATHQAAKK